MGVDETEELMTPAPGSEFPDSEIGELRSSAEHLEDEEVEGLEGLKKSLNAINVKAPNMIGDIKIDISEFPNSYKENGVKEREILQIAENFRRQYIHLYRDRKPIYVTPLNECGVDKLVCMTLRPTLLPYIELHTWDGASDFVADYLNYEALDPPTELPTVLASPQTILRRQKGNSFDYSTLLCSLLLGAGYDAYVVSGYASREICNMDQSRETCPLLKGDGEVKETVERGQTKKYAVKPPKDLQSKFERRQKQKKIDAEKEKEEELKKEKLEKLAALEKPPPDPLHGLRVHSWIVVLAGKREVPETFFIDALSGLAYTTNDERFHGIESIWNHQNYWVNMQDCSSGCKELMWDLLDCTGWEYMFNTTDRQLMLASFQEADNEESPPDETDGGFRDLDEEGVQSQRPTLQDDDIIVDMPPSWTENIVITPKDFEMRCPAGKKVKLYKKAKLEKFAPYLMKDGLVSRLSVYSDSEMKALVETKEFYRHRADKLKERIVNNETGFCTENYYPGRSSALCEHVYKVNSSAASSDRVMTFYHKARVDGLARREEHALEMTEAFAERPDHLYYRHTLFNAKKNFAPSGPPGMGSKGISRIVERFHRNPDLGANDDVAEIVYNAIEDKISLTYHTEEERISASVREFQKPPGLEEKGVVTFTPDLHRTFQVDPTVRPKRNLELYEMLVDLLRKEETSKQAIRQAEIETKELLEERMKEELVSELEVSVYDTERNEKYRTLRRDLERKAVEEELRRHEMELDYLAPFLAQLGDPPTLTKMQASKLKSDCLADLKQRLIDKANLIQSRFERETAELQRKQQWYQQNQVSMLKEDEDEYLSYCAEAMFRIHILELRLNRHREMAPHTYEALEKKLRNDPRLIDLL